MESARMTAVQPVRLPGTRAGPSAGSPRIPLRWHVRPVQMRCLRGRRLKHVGRSLGSLAAIGCILRSLWRSWDSRIAPLTGPRTIPRSLFHPSVRFGRFGKLPSDICSQILFSSGFMLKTSGAPRKSRAPNPVLPKAIERFSVSSARSRKAIFIHPHAITFPNEDARIRRCLFFQRLKLQPGSREP